jgi:hypothetical protein
MINEPIRPDNENELLNELLDKEINYRMTVSERIIERKC